MIAGQIMTIMNSRSRVLTALECKEPDRVPFDLGGTHVSGIHVKAYIKLCNYLGIDPGRIVFTDQIQQIVLPCPDLLEKLGVDTRGLFPLCSHNCLNEVCDSGQYLEYKDEWGIIHHFPKEHGLWWSMTKSPLPSPAFDAHAFDGYLWPTGDDRSRIAGLRQQSQKYRKDGKVVIIKGLCAGLFEMAQRIRGMENILCDFLVDPENVCLILDKLLEIKKRFWIMALDELYDLVDIVVETDDYGTQESQLISHELFTEFIKPRLADLIACIKQRLVTRKSSGEKGYVFFHSCGKVRPFIPDFVEIGIDIMNPVHITAAGMEPAALKRDFGRKITFWGGGVETQHILPSGSIDEIKDNVRRNLDALMPGGGFVFNTVHNIQAEVPPRNVVAMFEALQQYGVY